MNYLEYKERETIIPQIETTLQNWNELVAGVDKRLKQLKKKF